MSPRSCRDGSLPVSPRSWAARQSEICQPLPCSSAQICRPLLPYLQERGVGGRLLASRREEYFSNPVSSVTEVTVGIRDELRTHSANDLSYEVNSFFLGSLKSCASFPQGKKCQHMKEEGKLIGLQSWRFGDR